MTQRHTKVREQINVVVRRYHSQPPCGFTQPVQGFVDAKIVLVKGEGVMSFDEFYLLQERALGEAPHLVRTGKELADFFGTTLMIEDFDQLYFAQWQRRKV